MRQGTPESSSSYGSGTRRGVGEAVGGAGAGSGAGGYAGVRRRPARPDGVGATNKISVRDSDIFAFQERIRHEYLYLHVLRRRHLIVLGLLYAAAAAAACWCLVVLYRMMVTSGGPDNGKVCAPLLACSWFAPGGG